jgi:hypothetical protein
VFDTNSFVTVSSFDLVRFYEGQTDYIGLLGDYTCPRDMSDSKSAVSVPWSIALDFLPRVLVC